MTATPSPTPPGGQAAPARVRPFLSALGRVRRHPGRSLAVLLLLALIAFGVALAGVQVWASYHFRAARRELDRYHTAAAGEHIRACLTVWPNDPDVLFVAARAARRGGLFDEADDFLDRYQQRRGRDDDVVMERALLTADRGDVEDVLTFCRARVAADDPATPLILEAVARGCLRGYPYRLRDADWAVGTWHERDPDNPMGRLLRGRLARERFADTEAAADFRRALEIDPEMGEARERLAELLLETHQPAEALPHFEYLARRWPDDAALGVHRAQCQDGLGHQDEAVCLLDGVLARQPNFASALAERGKLALNAGQYDKAETCLRRAIELTPWDVTLLPLLQKCLFQSGQADKARAMEPQLKRVKEDLERLDQLVAKDLQKGPDNADAQYEAGTILLRLGSHTEGLRRLQNAVRLGPRHVKAHEALAEFYERAGDARLAAKHRQSVRELTGQDGSERPAPAVSPGAGKPEG